MSSSPATQKRMWSIDIAGRTDDIANGGGVVFRSWVVCSTVLIVKMLVLLLAEGWLEIMFRSFQLPEDAIYNDIMARKTNFPDNNRYLERVRIAQHSDLMNTIPLILAGYMYVQTNPSGQAVTLLRAATLLRFVHTILLVTCLVSQPARTLAFMLPLAAMLYMCVQTLRHFGASR